MTMWFLKMGKDLNRPFIEECIQMITRIWKQAFHKERSPNSQVIRELQMKAQSDNRHTSTTQAEVKKDCQFQQGYGAAGESVGGRELGAMAPLVCKSSNMNLAEAHGKRNPVTGK